MALYKLKEFYPDYREQFGDHDILSYDLYSNDEKVGSIDNMLVDESGKFRYFIISTGIWIFGKKVLLPIGQTRIDYAQNRVYANGLTREQVENLPDFNESELSYDHEEQVRGVYRPTVAATGTAPIDSSTPLETSTGLYDRNERTTERAASQVDRDYTVSPRYDRDNYKYDYDPALYNMNEQNHQNLRLYEERLIANKTRQKTGDVVLGKRVESETAHVSVPVEKERVVIERTATNQVVSGVDAGDDAFRDGEVARMEVFEETPDIHKETVLREEVKIRKEVDRDTVEAEETLRKERLDIDKQGNPIVRDNTDRIDRR